MELRLHDHLFQNHLDLFKNVFFLKTHFQEKFPQNSKFWSNILGQVVN